LNEELYAGHLRRLSEAGVDFIVVGGVAAGALGSGRTTTDLDVVYARDVANLERLAVALRPLEPTLRGAPPGLPFRWDAETLKRGLNFTLTTSLGSIDVLGEITGAGGYEALVSRSAWLDVLGVRCRCIDLPTLIRTKRAAGRPKDLEAIAELEALLEEREAKERSEAERRGP
jgi:predicted nucleotidyltransferase